MTPKEKAKELVDRYFNDYGETMPNGKFILCIVSTGRAKQCALICVDEIIKSRPTMFCGHMNGKDIVRKDVESWEEVKREIEKL